MASICQRCGAPIGPGVMSCSRCGSPVVHAYQAVAQAPPFQQGSSNPGALPRPHSSHIPGAFPREHIPRDETIVFETRPNFVPYVIQPLIVLPLLVTLFLLYLFAYSGRLSSSCLLFGVLFLVIVPTLQVVFSVIDWMSRKFALTSDKIVASSGIFSRHLYQCTYDKVQNITLNQGLLGRLVGYGTIAFWTAGFGGGTTGMGFQSQVIGGGGVIWFRVNDPVNLKRYVEEVVSYYQKEKKLQEYKTMATMLSESQRIAAATSRPAQDAHDGAAKFCSSCGSRCNEDASFCEKCGHEFGA